MVITFRINVTTYSIHCHIGCINRLTIQNFINEVLVPAGREQACRPFIQQRAVTLHSPFFFRLVNFHFNKSGQFLKMSASLLKITGKISSLCKRDIGVFAPVLQKSSDPIQQLFLDKIKEFKQKSSGGKLIDPSPEIMKELENERIRVYKQFNNKPGEDLTKFPQFNFTEPKLESLNKDQE